MSALTQFFGSSGGGGGEIPVKSLVLTGGNGASCRNSEGTNPTNYATYQITAGGAGAFNITTTTITPGVTVPITVGAGGQAFAGTCVQYYHCGSLPGWTCCIKIRNGSCGCSSCFGECHYISVESTYIQGVNCFFPGPYPCGFCPTGWNSWLPTLNNVRYKLKGSGINGGRTPYGCDNIVMQNSSCSDSIFDYASVKGDYYQYTLCMLNPVGAPQIDSPSFSNEYTFRRYCSTFCEWGPNLSSCTPILPTSPTQSCYTESYFGVGRMHDITGSIFVHGQLSMVTPQISSPVPQWPTVSLSCVTLETAHPIRSCVGHGVGGSIDSSNCLSCCPFAADSGTVIIQYSDVFGASSTSSPCVFDCSPQTPGCYTYRFVCPGSITFP